MKIAELFGRCVMPALLVLLTLRMCETYRLGIACEHLFPMRHTHIEDASIRMSVLEVHLGACMHASDATHTCISTVLISKLPRNGNLAVCMPGESPSTELQLVQAIIGFA